MFSVSRFDPVERADSNGGGDAQAGLDRIRHGVNHDRKDKDKKKNKKKKKKKKNKQKQKNKAEESTTAAAGAAEAAVVVDDDAVDSGYEADHSAPAAASPSRPVADADAASGKDNSDDDATTKQEQKQKKKKRKRKKKKKKSQKEKVDLFQNPEYVQKMEMTVEERRALKKQKKLERRQRKLEQLQKTQQREQEPEQATQLMDIESGDMADAEQVPSDAAAAASAAAAAAFARDDDDNGDSDDNDTKTKNKKKKRKREQVREDDDNDDADDSKEHNTSTTTDALLQQQQAEDNDHHHHVSKRQRVTPHKVHEVWVKKGRVIDQSVRLPVKSLRFNDEIVAGLKDAGITELFPVQVEVVPVILRTHHDNDVCVSAPTGSGKTLSYVLPIVQSLSTRVVRRVRALVLVPTRELVHQAKEVFDIFCPRLGLTVETLMGENSFASEQRRLVAPAVVDDIGMQLRGGSSLVDIVIATPGRLVDHIHGTPGFTLQHLQFLVVDEADKLLNQTYQDWVRKILSAVHDVQPGRVLDVSSHPHLPPNCVLVDAVTRRHAGARVASKRQTPLQKLLFSATLTQNPEKLAALKLRNPVFFASTSVEDKQFAVPSGLDEYMIVGTAADKPLLLLRLLQQLGEKQKVIVFADSLDSTHRLYRLLEATRMFNVAEFSSSLAQERRNNIVKRFRNDQVDIIVCSDAMARGMDIQGVDCVINYEVPPVLQTYIHRVGRTARAGRAGAAYTILRKQEVRHFKTMLESADNNARKHHKIRQHELDSLRPVVERALQRVERVLGMEAEQTLFDYEPIPFDDIDVDVDEE